MWHFSIHQLSNGSFSRKLALSLLSGVSLFLLPQFSVPQPAKAQAAPPRAVQSPSSPPQAAPTVRYARGEDINLAEIVSEWRGYYADIPVYLCTCQEDTCNQTQQWPYREYDRYQLGVALGPANGQVAEASGANCFDIADGSRPSQPRTFSAAQRSPNSAQEPFPPATPQTPSVIPPAPPSQAANADIPTAKTINNGAAIQLTWPSGAVNVIEVTGSSWNVNVLNAFDCKSSSLVEQKTMEARRIVGEPAVNGITGDVAVPVLLDSCIEVDQSAVFVLDPSEGGGYSLYRAQLPGARSLPNEFSTYSLSSIAGVRYWDGSLLVRHGSASGAEALMIFRSGPTPAGDYAGCGVTRAGEGASVLCPPAS